jgi:sulfoxide reductase heme-binding subunit YedZ
MLFTRRVLKPTVFVAALTPFLYLLWRAATGRLSANPIEDITLTTGLWTLRFVLITLAVTPIRRLTGWHAVIRLRRMLGLFAFFYGTLHLLTYVVLDQFFAWHYILADIAKRPYITVGFAAFVLMIPLAVTSTAGMIRRLGGRRWALLHRLIYLTAIGGVVHYLWKVKADTRDPLAYGAVLAALLAFRAVAAVRKSVRSRTHADRLTARVPSV